MDASHVLQLTVILDLIVIVLNAQNRIPVVGVWPEQSSAAERALKNMEKQPQYSPIQLKVITPPNTAEKYDEIIAYHDQLSSGNFDALIGYQDEFIESVASKLQIPFFSLSSDAPEMEALANTFVLGPPVATLVDVILSLVKQYEWKKVAMLHDEKANPFLVESILSQPEIDLRLWHLKRRAGSINGDNVRESLKEIREMRIGEILLMTHRSTAEIVLQQARNLGMVATPFSYILVDPVGQCWASDLLYDLKTNITAIQIWGSEVEAFVGPGYDEAEDLPEQVTIEDLLACIMYAYSDQVPLWWTTLLNSTVQGVTGPVIFNADGHRFNTIFYINAFYNNKFVPIGYWKENSTKPLKITFSNYTINDEPDTSLAGKTFKVVTILEPPWAMLKADHEEQSGNGKYYGFAVDLINEISAALKFKYEMYIVHDGKFGSKTPSGEWDGIVGEILAGNASMSVAPLSINADREEALDFTKPFKTRGITVLIKTPKSQTYLFDFMRPLSTLVWILVFLAFLVLSISLFILEKCSIGQSNSMPKLDIFTESCWFMFASLVGGGAELAPTTLPGRIMSSGWWFFSLILISTYTANLAAFLTVKKINPPISSVGELVDQNRMKYGTVKDSGVENFFRNTKVDPFWRMYEQMALFEDMMVNSTQEGLRRVQEGDYAFLWDNSVNSYLVTTQCQFTEIGPAFDAKGFGIGLPPGSVYLDQLSMAILKLADSGRITELEYQYWVQSKCQDSTSSGEEGTEELQIENVAGIFIILLAGLILAIVVAGVERLFRKYRGKFCDKMQENKNDRKNGNIPMETPHPPSHSFPSWPDRPGSTDRPVTNRPVSKAVHV